MKKMLINIISFNLLTSVFYMLMATYVSVDLLASLGFTTQILNYVGGFTSILLSSNIPYFAALFSMNRLKYLNGIVIRRGVTSMTCYIVVVLIFVFLFPYLQKIMDLKTNILSGNIFVFISVFFMTMEYGIGLLGIYLLVCNELRLMIVSLMVSTLILLITFVLMQMKVGVSLIFIVRGIIVLVFAIYSCCIFCQKNS